jgi:hypothetical protein
MQQADPSDTARLGNSTATVHDSGCFDVATTKMINSISGREVVTPIELAKQVQFFDKNGKLNVEQAIRYYTDNPHLSILKVENRPDNPTAVVDTLARLQSSTQRFAIMGIAEVTWTDANGAVHSGTHAINLSLGNGLSPSSVTIAKRGTADADKDYSYTLDDPVRPASFQISSIIYAPVPR